MIQRKQAVPRDLQARRIRWQTGAPPATARTLAALIYGEDRA